MDFSSEWSDSTNLNSGVQDYFVALIHLCAIDSSGQLRCYFDNSYGQSSVPAGFTSGSQSVKGGYYHTCGINSSGALLCWGAGVFNYLCSTCYS